MGRRCWAGKGRPLARRERGRNTVVVEAVQARIAVRVLDAGTPGGGRHVFLTVPDIKKVTHSPLQMDATQDDATLYVRSLLRDAVLLRPFEIGSNVEEVLSHHLRRDYEGRCSKHGFVLPGTVKLSRVISAIAESKSLNGDVRYEVSYHATVCNPAVGTVLSDCRVVNMNRFGLLMHKGVLRGDGAFLPVVEALVAMEGIDGRENEVDPRTLKIGDVADVEIVDARFELSSDRVLSIGRLRTTTTSDAAAASVAARSSVAAANNADEDSFFDATRDEDISPDASSAAESDVDESESAGSSSNRRESSEEEDEDELPQDAGSRAALAIAGLLVSIGSRFVVGDLTPLQARLLRSPLAKRLVLFCMVYLPVRNVLLSIAISAAFSLLLENLLNEQSPYSILSAPAMQLVPSTLSISALESLLGSVADDSLLGSKAAEAFGLQ
ncbi:hypothetical protein CEUSTIGMA_g11952.t1 [Chlamydomonas eustigma]|uniref:S1 motif domain-containing protein n=1 Tax=Chlamydomonas eustigma TaxID=1157962 RepID=A0A250XN70_9CHLO|nr:hypothetical protein CEUSTIGMA_g11952.t1 [Chlamydomonas eustigma]|eukprot:GAX84531.1 hypothetical protein CEUSTIGMA_g11952.t1 [Chlamydomonas eustigma]